LGWPRLGADNGLLLLEMCLVRVMLLT